MDAITYEQLQQKLLNNDLTEAELSWYFILDEENGGPFSPRFKINQDAVLGSRGGHPGSRSAMAFNAVNKIARQHRWDKFRAKMKSGYLGPVIVSEGDSWFQYPILLKDTIDYLMKNWAIYSMGFAGDLLEDMADGREYIKAIRETNADVLLLSGGGNDLVANGALADHLESFDQGLTAEDYLLPSFHRLLDDALGHYGRIVSQVDSEFPNVSIICHGYDYPIPDSGRWLGKPMESRGIIDRSLQREIASRMMDHFNRRLRHLASQMSNVTYIDCRGVVREDRWHDELHPVKKGYKAVARLFDKEIRRVTGSESRIATRAGSPPRISMVASANAQESDRTAAGRPSGISLHVGVNSVDPNHYDGWDGRLQSCEFDAIAMQKLADAEGFRSTRLLTQNATRENVIEEIKKAARELVAGDMFLFTVSAHGGRIPDFNQDEDHDDPDKMMDETLCLFDFQLADDELYMLWAEFEGGVRILVVPDTCHSGSMIRMGGSGLPSTLFGRTVQTSGRARYMPLHVEDRVWRIHADAYRSTSNSYSALKESIMTNPLKSPIKATVLNLGACEDRQFATDGENNGAFTEALLEVWNQGGFNGGYREFRDLIDRRIGRQDQTPQLFDKLHRMPEFINDRPFTLHMQSVQSKDEHSGTEQDAPLIGESDGEESDQLSDMEAGVVYEEKTEGLRRRTAQIAFSWSEFGDFVSFIEGLELEHFAPDEFLYLGSGHNSPGAKCSGKNNYPPRELWENIAPTARLIDRLRARLGRPIAITNAYRAPEYNSCIGGVAKSQHKRFSAVDIKVKCVPPFEVAETLRTMRDDEFLFSGGIGRYNTFTHVDTRGVNVTWPAEFRNSPRRGFAVEHASLSGQDRVAILRNMDIKELAVARSRGVVRSAYAVPAVRSHEPFDPASEVTLEQHSMNAAISASSVLSFVDNMRPGQKEDVLLSTLFAQRAADAKADPVANRLEWYRVYKDTLGILGWVRQGGAFESSHKMNRQGSFDKVVLSVIARIATGNQFKILESAINALKGLADDDDKIRLFDLETTEASGGNFQVGTAEAQGEVVSMALGAFNFSFTDRRKNILFVSWGGNNMDYWLSADRMVLSTAAYDEVRDVIKDKLKRSKLELVADIEI